ncbi:MAG: glycoside hydrolase family 2 TIM barrel-domain containing protein [Candidatus Saccharimonadales bacterium]
MAKTEIIPTTYGVSFSLKQCRSFKIDADECLRWLLGQGWRRFRLMSYWNEHEKEQGTYDFTALDAQVKAIRKKGGVISLCLGVKQPRWPEYHWPAWALQLSEQERTEALLRYIKVVIERYKNEPAIVGYQLENEALLKGFGKNIHINRGRLRAEYDLVRALDPSRPIAMSTSNGWGIPLRKPTPKLVGFSLYTIMNVKGQYKTTIQRPWLHQTRAWIIKNLLRREVFIHELQCEPWGPKSIWEMSPEEQAKSMSNARIVQNITWAKQIGCYPIDLWGAEWWYVESLRNDGKLSAGEQVQAILSQS